MIRIPIITSAARRTGARERITKDPSATSVNVSTAAGPLWAVRGTLLRRLRVRAPLSHAAGTPRRDRPDPWVSGSRHAAGVFYDGGRRFESSAAQSGTAWEHSLRRRSAGAGRSAP